MPHKMNSRSCERVNGFNGASYGGHLTMVADAVRWAVERGRRVVTRWSAGSPCPDAFFALDGLFETFLTVLAEFGAFPAVIERENERYLPVPRRPPRC